MFWPTVIAIGRILAETGSPPPDVDDDTVLLIKRSNVVIGCSDDAGVPGDAGVDAMLDALDAGPPDANPGDAGSGDAGVGDAGVPPDAGSTCTMIAGDAVTMVLQPRVSINALGTRFAVLLVTPSRPIIEVKGDVFGPLAAATGPKIVVHEIEVEDPALGTECATYACGGGGGDDGCDTGGSWSPPDFDDDDRSDGGVAIETIGPYEVLRAQPTDAAQLEAWLTQLGYDYLPADISAVSPYIERGSTIVAVRVALDRPVQAASMMPIALTWAGSELRVPVSLGGLTSGTALTVYIAADGAYTFSGARIAFSGTTSFMNWVTKNELVLGSVATPDDDPIAYRGNDTPHRDVKQVTEYVRVPAKVECEDEDEDWGCCSDGSTRKRPRLDLGVIVIAVAFVLRRRRR
jgi:hypothetical protein